MECPSSMGMLFLERNILLMVNAITGEKYSIDGECYIASVMSDFL